MKKQGILLCNLGTPDAPTAPAVRQYLAEFLHDKRVVSISRWIWCLILHGIILRIRPAKVAKLYQKIWLRQGSPLLVISQQQRQKLQNAINDRFVEQKYGKHIPVEIAMAYGNPSIAKGLKTLEDQGCERIIIMPLYPQYCSATSASIFDRVAKHYKDRYFVPEISYVGDYHDHELYIKALADSIQRHWHEHGQSDKLLFSYHGVPKRFSANNDPYEAQCRNTTELVAQALGLDAEQFDISFQSQFGKEEWIGPATDAKLTEWAKEGVESVQVVCPAFSADCLETLEEIAMENKQLFLENHSQENASYQYIPALNDDKAHIQLMLSLVEQRIIH
ncbi:MAG: ferrochelatase [Kangiellaceae bacterium]|nr:ferrochelatase [Kangiellaceae bacterium]